MADSKDRPAELDAAEKTVRDAGGVPTELFFGSDGRIHISFEIPGHNTGATFVWDREESLVMLYDFVRSRIPRVVAIPRTSSRNGA